MALTECKSCGKRVSDTTEKCIHCGHLLKKEANPEKAVKKPSVTKRNYNVLSEYERNALEMEFIRKHQSALKYKAKQNDLLRLKRLKTRCLPIWCVSFILLVQGPDVSPFFSEKSSFTLILALIFNIALMLCILASTLYISIANKADKSSSARYIYLKKYQKWLLNEKEIEYQPLFNTEKETILFEETDLDCLAKKGAQRWL